MKKNDKDHSENLKSDIREKGNHHHEKDHESDSCVKEEEKTGKAFSDKETTAKEAERESALKEKLTEQGEKYLRLLAEYDNYRKRTARELEFVVKTATEKLVAEFLPILDNLDRATEHRNNKTTYEDYVNGIILIEDQLRAVLAHAGLESIEVVGKKFDPAVHSAIMQTESETEEPGTIIAEAEKGYLLNGKIIRHPKVVVSKKPEKEKNKE
jgi:molecular chaperone GrpE